MKKIIKDFYKKINLVNNNGDKYQHTLFDYEKIWEDEAPIFLIISERGAKGKSTQGKYLAKTIWDKYNLRTMWLMNTQVLIDKEKKSHLSKPKQFLSDTFPIWCRVQGDFVYDNLINDLKDNWYTRFSSLSTIENEKGSRDDYGLVIYDEFNVGLSQIRNSQVDLLSSLIGTLSDPVNKTKDKFRKFIIHGNFKSLNNQFLIDLGITKIDKEVTDIYVGDHLLMRILAPIMDEEDKLAIEEVNKDDWKFLFQKKMGKEKHVYYNENLYDVINNVNTWMITLPVKSFYIIKINKYYYRINLVFSKDYGSIIYMLQEDKPNKELMRYVFCLNKIDMVEGTTLNTNLKRSLFKLFTDEKIFYNTVFIRENLLNTLRK